MALVDLVGTSGLASLLTEGPLPILSEGVSRDKDTDLSDVADLLRRLHVPNYERATVFQNQSSLRNISSSDGLRPVPKYQGRFR
jgi:hypothetical protein